VVVGGLFLFPESTGHCSLAPYLISRKENPSLQLLLIRVKWKPLLPLCVCLPSSLPAWAKFRHRGGAGERTCAVGT